MSDNSANSSVPNVSQRQVGLIGIGLLGSAIAERLVAANFDLIGFDADTSRREFLDSIPGKWAADPIVLASQCDLIILSLPDSDVVTKVIQSIESSLTPGTVVIDTTTGEPTSVEEIGRRLADRNVHYLDATIAGSSQQCRLGEVVVLAGGDKGVYESCRDIFAAIASKRFYLGPCGAGSRMKLVVNLAIGLNRAVLAESLSFAAAMGFELQEALDVLMATPAHSRIMDTKGRKMVQGDFTPQARLRQHLKDVKLILNAASEQDINLPLSDIHHDLLQSLNEQGHGDDDNSVIIKAFLP